MFAVLALAFTQMASGALTNRYVIKDNAGAPPYDGWGNAAADIQTAIDYAMAGETVLVAAATYDAGGITNYPADTVLTNRVAIWKAITVRSANNDPTNTIIKGAKDNGTNGPASVRCVYMTNGSALIGFTLTNGATLPLNYPATGTNYNHYGGGVFCPVTTTPIISNCVITANSASWSGGGSFYGTLYNCTLFTNVAVAADGGGSYGSYLYTCTLTSNRTSGVYNGGGGAYAGYLSNCTIVGNSTPASGGGVCYASMRDCRLLNNYASQYTGGAQGGGPHYNCTFIGNSGGWATGAAMYATLYNCTLISNFAAWAGGTYNCTLYNCTVVGNMSTAGGAGGGVLINNAAYDCIVNCIIYSNTAVSGNGPNWFGYTGVTNCCTIGGTAQVDSVINGNITNPPIFVDWQAGNYRQCANSPGVNTGTNLSWMTVSTDARSKDFDGHSRIDRFSGIVDMGAYEHLPAGMVFRTW